MKYHIKVGLSTFKKIGFLLQWKLFKNNEKCFLFHLKSSFHSHDIQMFVLTFWSCRKNSLIKKIKLHVIIIPCTSFRVNPHSILCLNVKELLARSRHHIWSLSGIQTHNHFVHKRTFNHLAKLAQIWVRIPLL